MKQRKMIPYIRTSTDDKGQDPGRQLRAIEAWAAREGVELYEAEIDEGTSASKTSPLERPAFLRACERGKVAKCDGIVVESDDRFSRQGGKLAGHAEVEMRHLYGMRLWRADLPIKDHDEMVGDMMQAMKAVLAREWARQHSARVKQGLAQRQALGLHVGRKPKEFTGEQLDLAERLRAEGLGWRRVAVEVSKLRGADEVADPKAREARRVSGPSVKRALARRAAKKGTRETTSDDSVGGVA